MPPSGSVAQKLSYKNPFQKIAHITGKQNCEAAV